MARPLRIEFEGAFYHITARGNARQDIFLGDEDRVGFLAVLAGVVDRFGWICHEYRLMSNHYHLLIETPEANLSNGMRQLNGVYTQAFNRRHGWVGHVLQGRFKSILVEKESHLLELARYVVLNPVRANMVRYARQWKWSSYRTLRPLCRGQRIFREWFDRHLVPFTRPLDNEAFLSRSDNLIRVDTNPHYVRSRRVVLLPT